MLKKYLTESAGLYTANLSGSLVIIIDACPYSRIACEEILFDITRGGDVFSFECFTDYKLWNQSAGRPSGKKHIIFNSASEPYYNLDVVEFLDFFNKTPKPVYHNDVSDYVSLNVGTLQENDSILLLASKRRPQLYRNALITHYMVKNSPASAIEVASDFSRMDIDSARKTFTKFIHGKGAAESKKKRGEYFTPNDMRAMKILLSGENIKSASYRHAVSDKTLYTQCAHVLEKLAF
ncbi:hypothetical protein MAQ58_19530 [Enterobacter sp. DRP3]|nr:hypothetical protein [Enterobacter sp. DRP3]